MTDAALFAEALMLDHIAILLQEVTEAWGSRKTFGRAVSAATRYSIKGMNTSGWTSAKS
jgi:hypothetical protein